MGSGIYSCSKPHILLDIFIYLDYNINREVYNITVYDIIVYIIAYNIYIYNIYEKVA